MKYYLIAGEASGDLHASNLMAALKENDPKAEFRFLGGDLMRAVGGTLVKHYREMAFMGFIPVLLNLRTILNNMKTCQEDIRRYQPDVVILIDYPGFNLKIAKYVKTQLGLPVYYYISPKIWAWKQYRIRDFRRYVDRMFCILPFETEFFRKLNYSVDYVGNPSVDSVAYYKEHQAIPKDTFIKEEGLANKPILAFFSMLLRFHNGRMICDAFLHTSVSLCKSNGLGLYTTQPPNTKHITMAPIFFMVGCTPFIIPRPCLPTQARIPRGKRI